MHIPPRNGTSGIGLGSPRTSWQAELRLRFCRSSERTTLAERRHRGPLVVQKPLYPEGAAICHTVLVHPPGGIAGGDALNLDIEVEAQAHALMITPAATKWYKSAGSLASQHGAITVADAAVMELLPAENIVFDEARATMSWTVNLAGSAVFAGWDITCLGRRESGEAFHCGHLRQATRISRNDVPLWVDLVALRGNDPLLHSVVGLRDCTVYGTMVIAAGATPDDLRAQCRDIAAQYGSGCGVSAMPEIFAARYLGNSAEQARAFFSDLWTELRPWYAGRNAQRPRLWDT